MSSSGVMRVNSSYDDWYRARAVVEEELKAIGKALERIRFSSQLEDAFTTHLLAVHRQWCEACPPAREPGLSGGGLEKESPTNIHTRAAAAHNPMKQNTSISCVSTFTQTTDVMNGLQVNAEGEVDDDSDNDDVGETSSPLSMTCRVEDEESQADVNRALEKPSTEKVVSTRFIKFEVSEDEFPDVLLRLEENDCDVDMDSSKEETPSQQILEEEVPSQHIESGEQSRLGRTDKVPDHLIKHERDSQGHCDFDMAGSSSEAMSHQEPVEEIPLGEADGTNNAISALNCDVLGQEGDLRDPCLDSFKKVQKTSRTDDGRNKAGSTISCDALLSPKEVSADQCLAGLDSYKKVEKTSDFDCKMKLQCLLCSKRYSKRIEYQKHLGTRTCHKPFHCSVCSKKFAGKDSFDTHMMKHKGEKPFKCDHCSYRSTAKSHLKVHMRVHTGQKPQKPHHCSICDESFTLSREFKRHMITHTGQKPHLCSICGKGFKKPSDIKRHMITHTGQKPHLCSLCGKGFTKPSDLKRHMITHTGEKPHLCSLCGNRFTLLGNLKKHMMMHSGQQPHQCLFCDKRFTHIRDLKRHMMIHTGQQPHRCSICDKGFTQSNDLKRHMIVHTGQKPYQCSICGNRFTLLGNLKRHLMIHSGQKRRYCTLCGKRFICSQVISKNLR